MQPCCCSLPAPGSSADDSCPLLQAHVLKVNTVRSTHRPHTCPKAPSSPTQTQPSDKPLPQLQLSGPRQNPDNGFLYKTHCVSMGRPRKAFSEQAEERAALIQEPGYKAISSSPLHTKARIHSALHVSDHNTESLQEWKVGSKEQGETVQSRAEQV